MAWTEDEVHRWLAEAPAPDVVVGGALHDAAVLARVSGAPVLCADQCVLGVHADEGVDPRAFGAKAVLRTASDLAAAAARPVAFTLALRAPADETAERLCGAIEGAREAARGLDAWLVGGDLTCAPGPLGASVTALGSFDGGGAPPSRDRAAPGQTVVVSGPLGGSLRSGRHLRIVPRVEAGIAAHHAGATALMDVSDGLAWDLFRLARTAGVGVELDVDAIPVHRDAASGDAAFDGGVASDPRAALDRALHDGEDHELLATIAPEAAGTLAGWAPIGRVVAGAGLTLVDAAGAREAWEPGRGGWQHGADTPPRDGEAR